MSFAETYLSRYASRQVQVLPAPDPNLFLSVIIPVYNEPGLIKSLESLKEAEIPGCPWEIIIIFNEPEGCPYEHHQQNQKSILEVDAYARMHGRPDLNIHILNPDPFSKKKAGPGMARKIGMDESIRRFNSLDRPEGIIISFDADTICSSNYLREITGFYEQYPKAGGCTAYFEHDLDEKYYDEPGHRNAIVQYELYLRYFKMSLEWITFPYANYSLGSAFSVRANRYVMSGGMGLQQAGEDFYFLQKCLPLGNFWELNSATVYPSARSSDRVVFGTGPFISRFISEKRMDLDVFSFELFGLLKPLFTWLDLLDKLPLSLSRLDQIIRDIPEDIRDHMERLKWDKKIRKAFDESAGLVSFKKRFYHEISLLQIIKLLNELSIHQYPKLPVQQEFSKLTAERGLNTQSNVADKELEFARRIEKSKGKIRIS